MSKKVLVVDDNATIRTLLSMNLKKANYKVVEGTNGVEGLELVNSERPDLVISDILMPQMDGFEFCKRVRENSAVPMVPFIFLTSIDQVATELRGFRIGADDYLIKSNIKKEELLEKVEGMLKKSNQYKKAEKDIQEGLSGKISDLNVEDVLQLLSMNKKTGCLSLTKNEEEAKIYFDKGNLVHAEYQLFRAEEAIYNLGDWRGGVFRFESGPIDTKPTIHAATMNVIIEYCRITDEKRAT